MVSMGDTLIISYKSEMITVQLFSYVHIYYPKKLTNSCRHKNLLKFVNNSIIYS